MDALLPHLLEDPDGVGNAGLQGVIGVHQQNAGVGVELCILPEGRKLIGEGHDPAVGMGSHDRHVEHLATEHVGGADAACDHCCPGAIDACVRSLGPAESEFHDPVSLGRIDHSGCLGGNEGLMVQHVEKGCLDQLGLHDGRLDLHHRLPGEHNGALGNGIDVSREAEVSQIVQKIIVEHMKRGQIVDLFLSKVEIFDILDDLFQSAADGKAVSVRISSEKGVKDHVGIRRFVLEIALHHG